MAPRVERHGFFQVGAIPARAGGGRRHQQCGQPLFRGGIAPHVEAVGVERFFKRLDLRLGHRHFGFAQLGEILGADIGCQQADDHDDDQQFEQGKAARMARCRKVLPVCCMHPVTPYCLPSIHCVAARGGWPRTGDTRLPDAYQPTMPVMVNTIFSLLCEQQIPAETIQCARNRDGAARAWLAA
ncbi:hypothetical protein D3C72_1554890 [compost metagenome]